MSAEIICDGCGKREPMIASKHGDWFKPSLWFERSDKDGIQSACSRGCIKGISEESGKTDLVLPI